MKKTWMRVFLFLLITGSIVYVFLRPSLQEVTPAPQITKPPEIQNQKDFPKLSVVASNLKIPWSLVFLPGGKMLFTEREGRVRKIDKNGILQENPVIKLSDVAAVGEGGLLGITLHPDFSQNNYVYLYYTYSNLSGNTLNRVVRYQFRDERLTDRVIIVDAIPGASNHNGGRIKFGPNKLLYITTGDAQNPSLAQDKNSLAGKILRSTDDGKPAPDNPFNNLIYSYGHRNPQGIAWDNQGRLWETEHGSSAHDEINLIEPGKNYGWPEISGQEQKAGMTPPVLESGTDTWAPSGTTIYNNSLFFAGLRGNALYEARIQGKTAELKNYFKGELGRMRDSIIGPDNLLYILTSNTDGRGIPHANDDKILKINPEKL